MLRYLCSPGIFAVIAIKLLTSLQWHHCRHQASVVALVPMELPPLSMRRRLCCCHDGVVALVVLAPLPTLHGHCHPCCTGIVDLILLTSLPSRQIGVITVVAPALLPSSSWHVCAVALVSLPLSCWCCCPWFTGISALVTQDSLPSLCLRHAGN
jgi:hypothetical protein